MATIGTIAVKLKAQTAEFVKGVKSATEELESFADETTELGVAAGIAFAGMTAGLVKAIDVAADFGEGLNVISSSFGQEATPAVLEWAKATGDAMGRSQKQMADFGGQLQAMLAPMTGNRDAAADMSKSLAQLSVDLGSFFNAADDEALLALKSALSGSSEPMRRFGVVMTEASLQQFAFNQGVKGSIRELSEAQKVALRYSFIMDKTRQAQGDAAKTSESFANQMKRLRANAENLAMMLGEFLLPFATKLVTVVNRLIAGFIESGPAVKGFAAAIAGMGFVATGALATLTSMGFVLPTLTKGFAAFSNLLKGTFIVALKSAGIFLASFLATVSAAILAIGTLRELRTLAFGTDEEKSAQADRMREAGVTSELSLGNFGKVLAFEFKSGLDLIMAPFKGAMGEATAAINEKLTPAAAGGGKALGDFLGEFEAASKKTGPAIRESVFDFTEDVAGAGQMIADTMEGQRVLGKISDAFGEISENLELQADIQLANAHRQEAYAEAQAEMIQGAKQIMQDSVLGGIGEIGEVIRAGIEGASQGGVWGAVIAVIAQLLSKTESFTDITEQLNQSLGRALVVVDLLLKPLVPLFEILNDLTGIFAGLGEWVIEATRVVGWVADAFQEFADWIGDIADWVRDFLGLDPADSGGAPGGRGDGVAQGFLDSVVGAFASVFEEAAPVMEEATEGISEMGEAAEKVGRELSASLTNVPQGVKIAAERFGALDAQAFGTGTGPVSIGNVTIQTDDPEEMWKKLQAWIELKNFAESGNPFQSGGQFSTPFNGGI
jgi:hypothetical protein